MVQENSTLVAVARGVARESSNGLYVDTSCECMEERQKESSSGCHADAGAEGEHVICGCSSHDCGRLLPLAASAYLCF